MSFVQESKYPNAAAEFQKVLTAYPSAPEVPEAMWQLSLAFVQLHFCTDARALLGDLVKRYPKSPRATDAKTELKTIAKLPKLLHQLTARQLHRLRAERSVALRRAGGTVSVGRS
jgi:outer membrane protein assembly factor BamD (BamD/ComL family)